MQEITVPIEGALPTYGSEEAAGADIKAYTPSPIEIAPGERALIPTGIRLALPKGYELQIRPRSGLAYKHGVTVLNAPGTIDSDYRGEIKVLLINHGSSTFTVVDGMRIAQAVIAPVYTMRFVKEELVETLRGEGGFGHTGMH